MNEWSFYPVFVGTFLSIVLWLRFVVREHSIGTQITLSELGANRNANYFRFVLWLCGPLFGLTAIFYIFPRIGSPLVGLLIITTIVLELLVGMFLPLNKRHKSLHELIAYGMGLCMFASALGLAFTLPRFGWLQAIFVVAMIACAIGMAVNKRHFIFYEVAFIFISHFTMITAAVSLL